MPPKKTTTNSDSAEGSGKFQWEGPNDNKLLLMTQGRYVKPDEYEQLASAFPGTTTGSIRNRISALRVKQRNIYEENGWELPEGSAGHSAKKSKKETPQKRGSEEGGEEGTPSKKASAPRVSKVKKGSAKKVEEERGEDGPVGEIEVGGGVGVKEEVVEDQI